MGWFCIGTECFISTVVITKRPLAAHAIGERDRRILYWLVLRLHHSLHLKTISDRPMQWGSENELATVGHGEKTL